MLPPQHDGLFNRFPRSTRVSAERIHLQPDEDERECMPLRVGAEKPEPRARTRIGPQFVVEFHDLDCDEEEPLAGGFWHGSHVV
jgi:hypothetical protein